MSLAPIKSLLRQLVMVLSIMLILFAAYLSIGRQFMPVLASYKPAVEERLAEAFGMPVAINAIEGYFDGFQPAIGIQGLRLIVTDGTGTSPPAQRGLEFESATIVLDVGRSILQRQVVLRRFVIEGLDLSVRQLEGGGWQFSGISAQGGGTLDLEALYASVQRVSNLELTGVSVELQTVVGNITRFNDARVVIQNAGRDHFIHADSSLDFTDNRIQLSVEVSGDTLAQVDGLVHVNLPRTDYSGLTRNEKFGRLTLGELVGSGQAWLQLRDGAVDTVTLLPRLDRLGFSIDDREQLEFASIGGRLSLHRPADGIGWEARSEALTLGWRGRLWQGSNSHLLLRPGEFLRLKAEALDLATISEVVLASGLAGPALQTPLAGYNPRGVLRNLALLVPLDNVTSRRLDLVANLDNVAVDRVGGVPAMTGLNGYLELAYDFELQRATGMAEVESENFTIQIARLFDDTWSYDYVNGRVRFLVDNLDRRHVRVSSGMIVAESEIVDGRARFALNHHRRPDGELSSEFELLVGALRVDGSKKSPYLPRAAGVRSGLRNTMLWLDDAVVDAAVSSSGLLFRGSLLPGSDPLAKNFQAFFRVDDAELRYQPEWPPLLDLRAQVLVNNREADILVESARSLDLQLGPTTARLRNESGGELWVTTSGAVAGQAQSALDFLVSAPLNESLRSLFDGWQAEGAVAADLNLRIPLGVPGQQPLVDLDVALAGNSLLIPDYSLQATELTGSFSFDTHNRIHDTRMQGSLFGGAVEIDLQSRSLDDGRFDSEILVTGSADSAQLTAWPRHSQFVRSLLARTEGALNYRAQLLLEETQDDAIATRMTINSDLQGLVLNYPRPFGKDGESTRPLNLILDFEDGATRLSGVLGSGLSMRVSVVESQLDGIVYLGTMPGIADPWQEIAEVPGLELRGNLDVFNVQEWLAVIGGADTGSPTRGLNGAIASVELDVGTLEVFGQRLESVNVDIRDLAGTDYWTVGLLSESVAGSVLIPFDGEDYIEAYLAYLRLPAPEATPEQVEQDLPGTEPAEVERVDALASLDPRNFPRLRFFTGEFSIGERNYGLGQFTLDPGPEGARFSDLIANFRGLRIGFEGDEEPGFLWRYDGREHHSFLSGLIVADDLAEVLRANAYAASLESNNARFQASLDWPGSPAFFAAEHLGGNVELQVRDGRFLQGGGGPGALKLISILNFDAIMRRLRFSDDLLRRGLAFEEITGNLAIDDGIVTIDDRLIITGPSSVYQISGQLDLARQTIDGDMYITLPVSDNIPWLGLLTANIPLAIGAYLFEQIFRDQVNSLTSARYRLEGPWEGLQPRFEQAFGNPGDTASQPQAQPAAQ